MNRRQRALAWTAAVLGSLLFLLFCLPSLAFGQYVAPYCGIQGTLNSSSGIAARNATLTFSPSQVFFVAGSSVVVSESQCGTDSNGNVVGAPNPITAPRGSVQFVGTLPPGNYYVVFTWYDQFGIQTLPSPEIAVQLTSTGEIQILPPVGTGPPQAVGMAVYIGAAPGTETLQGTTNTLTAQFTQAVPLGSPVGSLSITSGGQYPACPTAFIFTGSGSGASATPACTEASSVYTVTSYTNLIGGQNYATAPVVTTNGSPTVVPVLAANLTPVHPPISNLTACRVVCNDAGFPTGTGYNVGLADASGNSLFNYPEMWQFFGPGSTYNLSQGIPYYHGQVTYPIPILTIPYNHNAQSISGPLSLTGYNLYNVGALGVGTSVPAWGVDVEGTGLDAIVNAKGGYLINGASGTTNQAPCSDGMAVDQFCTFLTSIGSIYYQTVDLNGTAQTQRPALNFSPYFTAADSSSPARTTIGLETTGTGSKVVTASAAGTNTYSACWDSAGDITAVNGPCLSAGFTSGSNSNGYWIKDPLGHIHQWGHISGETMNCNPITFPVTFTTLASIVPTVADDFEVGSSIEHSIVINASHGCTGLSITQMYDWVSSTGGNGAWWSADGY